MCLEAEHAAVVATLVRALVETVARNWAAGYPAPEVAASVLRAWSWQASRDGLGAQLIDPATGSPAPAGEVITALVQTLRPVLAEYGEEAVVDSVVDSVVAEMLRSGTGARRQREAYAVRHDLRDVVAAALNSTHRDGSLLPTRGVDTQWV